MFQFNFKIDEEEKNYLVKEEPQKTVLIDLKPTEKLDKLHIHWLEAEEVEYPDDILEYLEVCRFYTIDKTVGRFKICYLNPDFAIKFMLQERYVNTNEKETQFSNLVKAEKDHSDLTPGIYEGGAKIWECTYDLLNYLVQNFDAKDWSKCTVLDLGCGSGLLGIFGYLNGASVDFHDYNKEVLHRITMVNLLLNQPLLEKEINNLEAVTDNDKTTMKPPGTYVNNKEKSIKFYCGDWRKWIDSTNNESNVYDIILTSETIYNPSNQRKLLDCMYEKLKQDGVILLAAKSYYFGVGGDLRDFEKVINEDKRFLYKTVWKTTERVQREILELRKV